MSAIATSEDSQDVAEGIVERAMARSEEAEAEDSANAAAGEAATVADESAAAKKNMSALEENIISKGKNSYYFAHKDNLGKGGDKKNYGTPPRLLERVVSNASEEGAKNPVKSISNYSWGDGEKKVSIYVSLDGLDDLPKEKITLDWKKESLRVDIKDLNGTDYVLDLPKLNAEIDGAKFKKKMGQNKIVILLQGDGALLVRSEKKSRSRTRTSHRKERRREEENKTKVFPILEGTLVDDSIIMAPHEEPLACLCSNIVSCADCIRGQCAVIISLSPVAALSGMG